MSLEHRLHRPRQRAGNESASAGCSTSLIVSRDEAVSQLFLLTHCCPTKVAHQSESLSLSFWVMRKNQGKCSCSGA